MATGRDIRFRDYCDSMYCELTDVKARVLGLVRGIEQMAGPEREQLKSHIPHLEDIVRTIEWKIEILTKVCPFDWSGDETVERTASVRLADEPAEREFSGGYIGG